MPKFFGSNLSNEYNTNEYILVSFVFYDRKLNTFGLLTVGSLGFGRP